MEFRGFKRVRVRVRVRVNSDIISEVCGVIRNGSMYIT